MTAPTASAAKRSAGGRPGWRIRTRLAVLHATLFVACGAVLLLVQYVAVNRILGDHSTVVTSAPAESTPADTSAVPAMPASPLQPASPAPASSDPGVAAQTTAVSMARFVNFKTVVLDALVGQSLITLGILTVVAAALGWWTAGRSLARLHTVTAAARRISERNLGDRLALVGPDDEIKELGDTFDAMLARLDRAFAANRRFAANASHELRTPLALQRTALEIPLAQGRVPDDLRPSVERALRATERSERLVDSLLVLAKGQQGPERFRDVDLAEVTAEAVDTYRAEAAAADIVPVCDLAPAATAGDPVLLGQVAANLVANAVRHNRPGPDGHGHLHVSTAATGRGAELRVANSGPAIAPSDVEALFEPFHRGSDARLAGRGTGLGLSIVRAVVASHGGTVDAEARLEGGLVVTVRLPTEPPL